MSSKRLLRNASINNAKQIGFNNHIPISSKGILLTNPLATSTNNHHKFHINSTINNINENGKGLTEKQVRNAYLTTLTKAQLIAECKKRGQKTSGNRTELLQRLGVKMTQLRKQEVGDCYKSSNKKYIDYSKPSYTDAANGTATSFRRKQSTKDKEKEREERNKIVLWRRPIQTIKYSLLECVALSQIYGKQLLEHRSIITGFVVLATILGILYKVPGQHQLAIDIIRLNISFVIYWVGLGILSSVGLGTGLHTFILYLGPHIASVTLAAYECNSLNFPKPPYPDEIICPERTDGVIPNIWAIMSKVRFEAFLWGAGTALGELPPYFMARAARLSGYDPELDELEELKKMKDKGNLSLLDKAKLLMEKFVEKVGFMGILLCASIPNPLFDLAGITCGHFMVPFWTFFGATLLGKAVIKMHIQKIFVIIAFNESLIEYAVHSLGLLPVFGKKLQEPFKLFLENQKKKLHRQKGAQLSESGNTLAKAFELLVIIMVIYFVISILNSLAQSYHKRIHKKGGKVIKKLTKD